jgi:hypothetical protein
VPNKAKPADRNRVVIEPSETKPPAEGRYSDRVRIDPFERRYIERRAGKRRIASRT